MFLQLTTAAFVFAAASVAHGAVTPSAPGPGDSFNEGAACPIQYTIDSTGTWTNVSVDLMTGNNFNMVHVANVMENMDGTTGTGSISWTCPKVTPNSAIYFYQFTNNGEDPTWTTRFTIASSTGTSTTPTNSTQPGGQAIPWGTGRLVGAASSGSAETSGSSAVASASDSTTAAASTVTTKARTTAEAASSTASATSDASTSDSDSTSTSATAASSGSPTSTTANNSSSRMSIGRALALAGVLSLILV